MSSISEETDIQIKTNDLEPPQTRSNRRNSKAEVQKVVQQINNKSRIVKKRLKRRRLYSKVKRSGLRKIIRIPACEQFTTSEDKLILSSVLKLGPKFKVISAYFPSKSLSTVKNRYYKFLRYRWIQIMGKQVINLQPRDYDTLYKESQQQSCIQEEEIVETVQLFPEVKSILMNLFSNIKSLIIQ
ncbi:unnamed protein product (macronuclear) [Paramecium tetraurelia]|uniref:Myb-like domain-containing protein n=1 Tax=Paramecium tetraurelia TaxID=5888 RepID=A0DWF2_PARTE|nr:uncharacterized protein GSPATT00021011001 [Paramecium tetraurelia]CAK87369.1 unnamed protein product [Paramecium tetraurelia]|eukprot:XP_001454766.1 hypothetical protein (macronuclear) [Paramecium tetraurelia strain d4-2]